MPVANSQAAPQPSDAPIAYLAVAIVYKGSDMVGAQILGKAPSAIACLKAAQSVVGKFNEDSSKPAGLSMNIACVPVPPASQVQIPPEVKPGQTDPLNPESYQKEAA